MTELQKKLIQIDVGVYSSERGVVGWHETTERIAVKVGDDGRVAVVANRAGLWGLARDLLTLAQEDVPDGRDIYLMSKGQGPALVEGSHSLQLVRRDSWNSGN